MINSEIYRIVNIAETLDIDWQVAAAEPCEVDGL